jgi:hypothetical protein
MAIPRRYTITRHALLVYADLLSIDDDRTREVAQNIYDRYLRTIMETA